MSLIKFINVSDLILLYGKPILIPTSGLSLIPKTLGDIAILGEETFYRYLNIITAEVPTIEGISLDEFEEEERPFIMTILLCKNSWEYRTSLEKALTFFLNTKIIFNETVGFLQYSLEDNDLFLNAEQYAAIIFILQKQYNLDTRNADANPADEKARQILEKQKKAREKIAKIKQTQEITLTFADLISAVAVQVPGLNIINIWNLTYYSFYNQFHRLKMVEDYDIGLRSIMAGADSKKIKLKHWIEPIQTKEE